jgi:2-polyprenyl-3-methyl-5-hydroxy-6-metoxy-1,4-benzoquinol methylase
MKSLLDKLFFRKKHVCPWYCCFTFDNIFRKLVQNPEKILEGLVQPGMTVLDVGPGMGYFSIPMAKMVGPEGRILALDIQEKMLQRLKERAIRNQVQERVECRLVADSHWGITGEVDFALSFWMVHEVPNQEEFIASIYKALKDNGKYLIAEPNFHVSKKMMEGTIALAKAVGFKSVERPKIFFSKAVVLQKPAH